MEIFTACSFQDLTGQRTTKVINVLRYIEQRIGSMIAIWGEDKIAREDLPPDPVDDRPDSHLLHGPSLTGIDQNEVDQLMSGFAIATPSAPPPPPPKPKPEVKPIPVEEEEPAPHSAEPVRHRRAVRVGPRPTPLALVQQNSARHLPVLPSQSYIPGCQH